MMDDLTGKNSDKEYQLSEQQDAARQKGIHLNINEQMLKKFEELKKSVSSHENHCKALEGLFKNKGDLINHENDQIRIAIRNVQSQINNVYHTLEHSQD